MSAAAPGAGAVTSDESAKLLDDLVSFYTFAFESTDGGAATRRDELLRARRALRPLTKRRGWFADDDDKILQRLAEALAILDAEGEERQQRWNAAKKEADVETEHRRPRSEGAKKSEQKLRRLALQLTDPEGRQAPWREQFALLAIDRVGAFQGTHALTKHVEMPSLLARVEAVVSSRHPDVLKRAGVPSRSVYAVGDPHRNERAVDRWRQVVARVVRAQAGAGRRRT